jgi:hypothetical protein
MTVHWNTHSGHFPDAKRKMYEKVYRLNRNSIVKKFKIGITNDPTSRLQDYWHSGERYNHMYVIYETISLTYVRQMEYYLTDIFWEYCDNQIRGGGGGYGYPPYYTYVVAHIPKKYER